VIFIAVLPIKTLKFQMFFTLVYYALPAMNDIYNHNEWGKITPSHIIVFMKYVIHTDLIFLNLAIIVIRYSVRPTDRVCTYVYVY